MTPEQEQMLSELYQWMKERKIQQLSLPVDDASRNALEAATFAGIGTTTLTQTINTSGPTAVVPAAYASSVLVRINGVLYELTSLI